MLFNFCYFFIFGFTLSLITFIVSQISSIALGAIGMPLTIDNQLFNCAVVISQGKILGIVPKTYISVIADSNGVGFSWTGSDGNAYKTAQISWDDYKDKKDIEKIEIPTLDKVKEHNIDKYIEDINRKIGKESKNSNIYKKILGELRKENGLDDIALALLEMNLKLTDEYELNDINLSQKESKRKDRRDREKEKEKDKKSQTRKDRLGKGKQRIFLNVGRCHGAKKTDLLKAIEKASGVKKQFINEMDVFENFTFFTVDEKDTKKIISGVEGVKFGKVKMKAEKAKR